MGGSANSYILSSMMVLQMGVTRDWGYVYHSSIEEQLLTYTVEGNFGKGNFGHLLWVHQISTHQLFVASEIAIDSGLKFAKVYFTKCNLACNLSIFPFTSIDTCFMCRTVSANKLIML